MNTVKKLLLFISILLPYTVCGSGLTIHGEYNIEKKDTIYATIGIMDQGKFANIYTAGKLANDKWRMDSTIANTALIIDGFVRDYNGSVVVIAQSIVGKISIKIEQALEDGEVMIPDVYRIPGVNGKIGHYPKIVRDTLFVNETTFIKKGSKLKIGTGTLPDADFKFIRINEASLMRYYSTTGYQSLANTANAFPRGNSGFLFDVIRLEKRGNTRRGYVYYIVLGGVTRYEVDIVNALESGEVIVEGYQSRKSTEGQAIQPLSIADELKKLHDLKQQGILSDEEYFTQKNKLLNKQ